MNILLVILLLFSELSAVCSFSHIRKKVEKIDVVYTWVDGKDPNWQKAFQETKTGYKERVVTDSQTAARFRSHDELKYSLRSLHKYAPFINHIYIVSFSQRPEWLLPHPKISVIDHKELFLTLDDLPTFNSQAIEANLHHIHGLSECYIYFNDDVFLGRAVEKSSFFSHDGKPKIFLASWIAPDAPVHGDDPAFEASWKNTNALLNRLFGNKARYALEHAPFAFRRSLQKDVEKCLPGHFRRVSSHKFRSPEDLLLTAGFSQYLLDYYGLICRAHIDSIVIGLKDDLEANRRALESIQTKKPTTFCIEDAMQNDSFEQNQQLLHFFERYFPEKAPWEK